MSSLNTVLVIPCYNEKERLDLNQFKKYEDRFHFLFVDDGSDDETYSYVNNFEMNNKTVIRLDRNSGKAQAVRQGILTAYNENKYGEAKYFGFWDADLSTPLEEAIICENYFDQYPQVKSLWCSRVYRLGSNISRTLSRHYFGRVFATIIGVVLNLHSYDSQCGAKFFHRDVIPVVFQNEFISNWVFDVEIAMRLGGRGIVEIPVEKWTHKEGSKLSFFKDSYSILRDILRIYFKYGRL